MTNCLYYPHYTPSTLHLRSALLFYENLKTIVPEQDQYHVKDRDHVAEIVQIANKDDKCETGRTIEMVFPEPAYFAWWNDETEKSLLKSEIRKQKNSSQLDEHLKGLKFREYPNSFHDYLVVDFDGHGQAALVEELRPQGWRLVAAQKVPDEAIEYLRGKLVAVPLPYIAQTPGGRMIEMNPILMRDDIADFIIARLARSLGARHDCITLGLERKKLGQHLATTGPEPRQIRTAFMNFAIPCIIPDEVDELRIGDYWEIRSEYANFRRDLSLLVEGLTKPRDLHELRDVKEFFTESEHLVNEVFNRVEEQRKVLARRSAISLGSYSLGVGTTLVSSLIESSFGAVAGVATIFGTPIIEKVVNRQLDTLVKDDDSEFVKNTAMMSAEITKRANDKPRQLSKYMF